MRGTYPTVSPLTRAAAAALAALACVGAAGGGADPHHATPATPATPAAAPAESQPDSTTEGTVNVAGRPVHYRAIAGTLTVGSTNEIDALLGTDGRWLRDFGVKPRGEDDPQNAPATARMFYVAYFRAGAPLNTRPVIFLYNGGPSVASLWLHMGAFGPRRVAIPDTQHPSGAPYPLVENPNSLLDV